MALYDLTAMLHYVHVASHSKVFVVGHSQVSCLFKVLLLFAVICLWVLLLHSIVQCLQGTIMSLAAFTEPDIVKMVQGAALLCPITYLEHVSAPLVLRLVSMHLDQVILAF